MSGQKQPRRLYFNQSDKLSQKFLEKKKNQQFLASKDKQMPNKMTSRNDQIAVFTPYYLQKT